MGHLQCFHVGRVSGPLGSACIFIHPQSFKHWKKEAPTVEDGVIVVDVPECLDGIWIDFSWQCWYPSRSVLSILIASRMRFACYANLMLMSDWLIFVEIIWHHSCCVYYLISFDILWYPLILFVFTCVWIWNRCYFTAVVFFHCKFAQLLRGGHGPSEEEGSVAWRSSWGLVMRQIF